MSPSEFDRHKVDHLFLLVGENPLPNYVAAKLLIREKGTVHLVYSTRTTPEYDKLVEVLKGIQTQPVSLAKSEADGAEIRRKIGQALKPQGKKLQGRIGLNYTGGTKAMAVHAYQAIQDSEPASDESTVFSYLDSRTLQLFIDGDKAVPTRLAVEPSLDTLLALHNLSWKKDPIYQSQLQDAAAKFAKEFMKSPDAGYGDTTLAKNWKDWCEFVVEPPMRKYRYEKLALPDLLPLKVKDNDNDKQIEVPIELTKILREDLQSSSGTQLNTQLIKAKLSNQPLDLSYVFHWLNGGWLEDYVFEQIQKLSVQKPQYGIREISMSLQIQDPEIEYKEKDQFEFDVVFLIGYQLFAISCTTGYSHEACKKKLFEAQLRARQLGGDEARVALVSCYDKKPDSLRKELSLIIGNQKEEDKYDKRIEVFGRSDLEPKRFYEKLDRWIFRNT